MAKNGQNDSARADLHQLWRFLIVKRKVKIF